MDVPGIVEDALGDEEVAASVNLGGDDALYVTATQTLVYRGDGLLSDESIETYDHEADRLDRSEGRRKTRLTLSYPIEDVAEFTLPSSSAADAIPPIVAGILGANGVLEPDETVLDTFLFSELTLVVTSDRLVKHIGEAVWDVDFEEYHYEDVTDITAEEGSVATQLVLDLGGRAERIKTPNDSVAEVRQRLEGAVREYHGLDPDEDIGAALAVEDDGDGAESEEAAEASAGGMTFEDGVEPLSAGSTDDEENREDGVADATAAGGEADSAAAATGGGAPTGSDTAGTDATTGDGEPGAGGREEELVSGSASVDTGSSDSGASGSREERGTGAGADARTDDGTATATSDASAAESGDGAFEEAGFEPAAESAADVEEELAELRSAVAKQNRLLARQQRTIEQLIEELRRGR